MMDVSEDRMLGGRLRLLQPRKGHRAGTDALLLAHFALSMAEGRVADFGAGIGAAGLAVFIQSPKPVDLTLVEIDPALTEIAARNIHLNEFATARAICCDVTAPAHLRLKAGLERAAFQLVLMNPPFRDSARSNISDNPSRALAHAMPDAGFSAWVASAAHHLAAKGHLAIIHRADAITLLLSALGNGFGNVSLRFVHPSAKRPALRLLLTAQKGSRAPMRVLPPLVLHEADGRFTDEAQDIHNGTAAQPV